MSLLRASRPIIVQYVLAVGNGLATFLAVLAINRLLAGQVELFSQVSTLLYLLPLFLANIDLGSHNELLRRWPRCAQPQRGELAAELEVAGVKPARCRARNNTGQAAWPSACPKDW